MPRSNRGIYIAAGVASLGTAAIGWLAWPNVPPLKTYHYEEARNANYRAGGEACQPPALAAIRDAREAARQRDACAKEAEDHRLQSNDLIQQTRAANAAEAQASLAAQSLWLNFFQAIGGFLTLVAAAAAAVFARDAAYEAKRSADFSGQMAFDAPVGIAAAVEANNHAREATQRELRGYVRISGLSVPPIENLHLNGHIEIEMINYGQTPVRDIEVKVVSFVAPAPLPQGHQLPVEWERIGEGVLLHKDERRDFSFSVPLSPEEAALVSQHQAAQRLSIAVRASYIDAFNYPHEEQWCAHITYLHRPEGVIPRFETTRLHQIST